MLEFVGSRLIRIFQSLRPGTWSKSPVDIGVSFSYAFRVIFRSFYLLLVLLSTYSAFGQTIKIYRGELDASRRTFEIALQLKPQDSIRYVVTITPLGPPGSAVALEAYLPNNDRIFYGQVTDTSAPSSTFYAPIPDGLIFEFPATLNPIATPNRAILSLKAGSPCQYAITEYITHRPNYNIAGLTPSNAREISSYEDILGNVSPREGKFPGSGGQWYKIALMPGETISTDGVILTPQQGGSISIILYNDLQQYKSSLATAAGWGDYHWFSPESSGVYRYTHTGKEAAWYYIQVCANVGDIKAFQLRITSNRLQITVEKSPDIMAWVGTRPEANTTRTVRARAYGGYGSTQLRDTDGLFHWIPISSDKIDIESEEITSYKATIGSKSGMYSLQKDDIEYEVSFAIYGNTAILPVRKNTTILKPSRLERENISHNPTRNYCVANGDPKETNVRCEKLSFSAAQSNSYHAYCTEILFSTIDQFGQKIPYDMLFDELYFPNTGNIFTGSGFFNQLSDCFQFCDENCSLGDKSKSITSHQRITANGFPISCKCINWRCETANIPEESSSICEGELSSCLN